MIFGDAAILRPYWFLAALSAIGLAYLWRERGDIGNWAKAIDKHLLGALEARRLFRKPNMKAYSGLSLWLLAGALTCLAMAGPALRKPAAHSFRNLEGIVFAVDVSRSMTEGRPIGTATAAALQLAAETDPSRQIALVLYAGDAYPATVLSSDRSFLQPVLVGDLKGIIVESGSQPDRAIAQARLIFSEASMMAGDLVVFTDGGGIDTNAVNAARAMREAGHRAHVMFVEEAALPAGAPEPDKAAAAWLAQEGGGIFAEAAKPQPIIEALNTSLEVRLEKAGYGALVWQDIGRYLLLLAAIPMLWLFGRRA
jgi:Ca-activated chloride channel family protein